MNRSRRRLVNRLIKIAIVCGLILMLFKLNVTIKRNETEPASSPTDLLVIAMNNCFSSSSSSFSSQRKSRKVYRRILQDQADKINDERLSTVDRVCKKYKLGIYKDSNEVLFKHPPAPQYGVFYIVRFVK